MLKKLTAVILSAAMALSLIVVPVSAEDNTELQTWSYDFRAADNAYINSTNSSKEEGSKGKLTEGDYDLNGDGTVVFGHYCFWNDGQHGIGINGGNNQIVIKAEGPVKITVGGCQYSGASNVALKKTDGTEIETKEYVKTCLSGTTMDSTNSVTLTYSDEAAANLMVVFDSYAFIPMMTIEEFEPAAAATAEPSATATTEPSASATTEPSVSATTEPAQTGLPKDIHWTVNDEDFVNMATTVSADKAPMTAISREGYETVLGGYGKFSVGSKTASYTHTDGTTYNFAKSLSAGEASATKRSFIFTPKQACQVTVVYASDSTKPYNIYQGKTELATGGEGIVDGKAATLAADVPNPENGDIIIYGSGKNSRDIFGIFVDYYDPTVEVKHTVSGNITYAGSVDTSALKIVFEDKKDSSKVLVPFAVTYSTELIQYRDYDVYVGDADGTKVDTLAVSLDTNSISVAKQDITHNITVLDVAEASVTGSVTVHDINNDGTSLDLSGVTLKFTDKSNTETVYTAGAIASDGSYSVTLMSGKEYTVTAVGADGYDLSPLSKEYTFVAGDASPFKNILFTETLGAVEFAGAVHVGANKEYARINDAITAIKKMTRPAGEAGRVTIEIEPGTYTEQVYLDANYVTLKAADPENKPEINWYYGIGYIYYSSNGGYYSEDYAVAKTRKSTVDRWGTACRIYGEYVNLENIIFKNTFNCEVTATEIADGVEAAKDNQYSDVNGKPERTTENYDARTKDSAVERAAAIAIDKNYCEAYGCEFISSQDTFFTNSIAYIKDCYIEGATDYIFGGNSVVFDNCTLAWHGYSDKSTGGYITANKNSAAAVAGTVNTSANGYLFRDCTVTNSKYFTDNKFAAGSWGRNWGGANCQVVFDGVTMDGADLPGAWVKMGGELSTSILYVNDVTDKNGTAVDVSGTVYNPNGTMAAKNYTIMSAEDYFGGTWVPPHYVKEAEPTTAPTSEPSATDEPTATEAPSATGGPTATEAPSATGEPSVTVAPSATDIPDTTPHIVSAVKSDGNTVVYVAHIASGVVVAAKYNGTALESIKTASVSAGAITIEGIEADKVMVWNNLNDMEPLCASVKTTTVKPPAETAEPTTEPSPESTAAATTEPSPAPTLAATTEPEPVATEEPATTYTVTVTQPEGGTVTVYNESKFKSITADVPASVTENQIISDNDYFTFTAPGTVAAGSDSSAAFDNAGISVNYTEFRKSGSDTAPYKTFVYNAKADGYLTVYARCAENKKITFENTDKNTKQEDNLDDGDSATTATIYGTVRFNVEKDANYLLYVAGGTGRLFGVKYESTNYPQSTESLTVDSGDTVKAVVVPAANYVVNGITVDGEEHSGKEYTFEVNKDVTVSATLESEPALVELTSVASDAALTREVMGAILYDAYQAAGADVKANMAKYIAQNGGVPSPDDPNYDPNLTYEGTPYTPLTGWGALTDKNSLDASLYAKVKAAYNLGLIRSEKGIARNSVKNGTEIEPDTEVTRAKAAKSLVFAWILTQVQNKANQKLPSGNLAASGAAAIATPNPDAQSTVFTGTQNVTSSSASLMTSIEDETEMAAEPLDLELLDSEAVTVDFTAMSEVPVYSAEARQGFVAKSSAIMPTGYERQVSPVSNITVSSNGASVTESEGSYLHIKNNSLDGDDYNYGGLIYRIDTGKAGAYHIEVEVTGTSADTRVAPTGMDASRLTGTSNWDNAGEVPRTVSASWSGSTWSYDFGTGENFIEIEIEPSSLATSSANKTVGVKSITVTPIAAAAAGEKPTIHIIGDSTQKTYTFNETISAWGQTLGNYFDADKVNVVNYSMGGRAMKSNYCEGRFDEVLVKGKTGDYVFIHSAHNDETISTNRFSRGAGWGDLAANNENYNKWLDMYVAAIKARGMTPVLVTAMPRTSNGVYSENASTKPNGFNPDSPANMRAKAAADSSVGLAELYNGAKAYIDKLDANEVKYIYNSYEAGETPAQNAANGTSGDGTHYREGAAKQWSRIILQSIYDQSVATTDTYTDKAIMTELVKLMPASVQTAASTGDWSAVFPEMASDVSAVDVVPGATKQAEANYYYRSNIEKALELGLLHKDTNNLFKPTETITVGEYARGIEKAFGLTENSLASYTKTYAELTAE